MTDCTHLYAPCPDQCNSIVIRIDAMTAGHNKARTKLSRLIMIIALFTGALIFGGALGAIAYQGVENNRNFIQANLEP
jgi:hypothetical protein